MIDFHNHILPGVDDGAKTMDESVEMLKYAEKQGITDVVNTVHFQHPKLEHKSTDFKYIKSVKNNLENQIQKNKINIKIHLGAEVFFNFNLLDIQDNPLTTFCNGKYMLIEFPTHQFPVNYDDHLFKLAISGVTPIIAHPERYKAIQNDISIINKLIDGGCIIQIDAGSVLGQFGPNCKKTCKDMLKRRMVHILGSDSHGIGKRNFCLKKSISEIKRFVNYDYTDLVTTNPRNVIEGRIVEVPDIVVKKNSNLFSFFISKKNNGDNKK